MKSAVVLALVLFGWTASTASAQSVAPAPPPGQDEYIIGSQDVLSVTIFGEPDLSKELTVDNDGTIDFLLIGRIKAAGRTTRDIAQDLRDRLMKGGFLKDPSISVEVTKYRSQTVYVQGQVRNPGKFTLAGNTTIMGVLAEAGSMTSDAGSYILISRRPVDASTAGNAARSDNATEQIRISRRDLETGQAQNIRLRDGDMILVPKAETFYVTGFVRTPGSYVLDGDVTVLQAISLAGGPTERAAMNRVKIRRIVNDKTVDVKVSLTDLVKPNDTIIVPQRVI